MLVDSHCHLDRLDMSESEVRAAVDRARERGVEHFLCVAVSVKEFPEMMKTVSLFDDVSASCGVHPLHQEDACDFDTLLAYASRDDVVAVGETGLDYFYSEETKEIQIQSFIDHIKVAKQLNKPLIIHTRGAREDTIALLKEHGEGKVTGVLHCFTEDLPMAQAAIDMGFYISISGIVTFNKAEELREVVTAIPLQSLLVETDSPWLAPVPHRGKPNEPSYVRDVAEYIARLKGVSTDELATITTHNFYQLFSLVKQSSIQD